MQGNMELKMNKATMVQAIQEFFDKHMQDINATVKDVAHKSGQYQADEFTISFECPVKELK